jgi:hypothetical protein
MPHSQLLLVHAPVQERRKQCFLRLRSAGLGRIRAVRLAGPYRKERRVCR